MQVIYKKDGITRSVFVDAAMCATADSWSEETTVTKSIDTMEVDAEGEPIFEDREVTETVVHPAVKELLDGQDRIDWMLERGLLPFTSEDAYRIVGETPPAHPLSAWGQAYLDTGVMPILGEYIAPLSVADFETAIQSLVDETAVAKLYASGVALASYANSTNSQWSSEATAFIAWRDAVWLYAYAEMAKVQTGTRAMPTIDEILSELPAITWPAAT